MSLAFLRYYGSSCDGYFPPALALTLRWVRGRSGDTHLDWLLKAGFCNLGVWRRSMMLCYAMLCYAMLCYERYPQERFISSGQMVFFLFFFFGCRNSLVMYLPFAIRCIVEHDAMERIKNLPALQKSLLYPHSLGHSLSWILLYLTSSFGACENGVGNQTNQS